MSTPAPLLPIDVWADVACPWCWIGERRLQKALAMRPGVQTELRWRPFMLQPDLPSGGVDWDSFVRSKFGGIERARPAFEQVETAGDGEGITFAFERMRRAPLTLDAHRLILAAADWGATWTVAEALFRAHFTLGRNLNDRSHLLEAVVSGGLSPDVAETILDGRAGRGELQAHRDEAMRLGIRGVPFFVFGERYAVSGAHPPEAIVQAIDTTVRELVLQS